MAEDTKILPPLIPELATGVHTDVAQAVDELRALRARLDVELRSSRLRAATWVTGATCP